MPPIANWLAGDVADRYAFPTSLIGKIMKRDLRAIVAARGAGDVPR